MPQNTFSDMARKPYQLTDDERTSIDNALSRYLHMDEKNRSLLINDIELTGGFRVFGYGSLIGDPASENDTEYGGVAGGWEKGPFCKDRHYRGTPENLGVTMGALPTENGKGGLPGVIQEINSGEDSTGFANRVLENIKDFALRETSLNPIYEYKVVDVETRRNGSVKALICAADPSNPLYLGRDGEDGGLTIEEKASIIATSRGVPGASPRNTGMAYWRDHVKCCELGGFEPDPKIQRLVALAEVYREQLRHDDPELFEELIQIEQQNAPAGAKFGVTYADPIYNVETVSASEDTRRVVDLRHGAIKAADLLNDPLTLQQIGHIQTLKQELEAPTLH